MSNNGAANAGSTDRFGQMELLLSAYPNLSDSQVQELKTWWNKEASAIDIANLASKESLQERYKSFRAEHIDPCGWKDVILGILVVSVALALLAVIAILAD
jgi:hypothetical protein